MKISDKPTWDKVIYGLIYPGFLGSMLYELIPTNISQFSIGLFLQDFDTRLRLAILTFYLLDFMHLYGDMESALKTPERKTLGYFICDILTAFGYLFAFLALKTQNYMISISVFGLVPWALLWYKFDNIADKIYFLRYAFFTSSVFLYALVKNDVRILYSFEIRDIAMFLVSANVIIYFYYIFFYYEKKSRPIDEGAAHNWSKEKVKKSQNRAN